MSKWGRWQILVESAREIAMNNPQRRIWLPLLLLAVALLIWAGFFATGAYLQLGADRPQHDLRKPLLIMGSMAIFLSLWGLALWTRSRR